MSVEAYLFYEGRCEEAIHFYQQALGAEVLMLMRMRDSPEPPPPSLPPGSEDKVMHASLRVGTSVLMMSDGMGTGGPSFKGFALSVTQPDEAATQRVFAALGDGGQVSMPLGPTFWSPCFGMVKDRFGLEWMVSLADPAAPG